MEAQHAFSTSESALANGATGRINSAPVGVPGLKGWRRRQKEYFSILARQEAHLAVAYRGREQAETPNHAHGLGTCARTRGRCRLGSALRPSEPVCSGLTVVSTLQKKLMRGITSLEPGACHVYGTRISSGLV